MDVFVELVLNHIQSLVDEVLGCHRGVESRVGLANLAVEVQEFLVKDLNILF